MPIPTSGFPVAKEKAHDELKRQMEEQWAKGGCQDPLKPARWKQSRYGHGLLPDNDPFILDQDGGVPEDPEKPK